MTCYVVVDWDIEQVLFVNSSPEGAEINRGRYLAAKGWSDDNWSGSRVTIDEVDR